MKTVIFILTILTSNKLLSQKTCPAIVDVKYNGTIDIYDNPSGYFIHKLKNDLENEDFISMLILDYTNTDFLVSIKMEIKKDSARGWIKKASYIGAYKRHEKFPMNLALYKDKKMTIENEFIVDNWTPSLLTIEKYENDMAFISIIQAGEKYKGWIPMNELCANSYTYCN
jgi:hypothetical protein